MLETILYFEQPIIWIKSLNHLYQGNKQLVPGSMKQRVLKTLVTYK